MHLIQTNTISIQTRWSKTKSSPTTVEPPDASRLPRSLLHFVCCWYVATAAAIAAAVTVAAQGRPRQIDRGQQPSVYHIYAQRNQRREGPSRRWSM